MTHQIKSPIIGVLGGMGPLASAEFLKTLYELTIGEKEQDAPKVMMLSDPGFPDRTTSFLENQKEPLLRKLIESLEFLREQKASPIIICCITIHHLMPSIPADLRRSITSLIDVMFEAIERRRRTYLMLCTTGTRNVGLFQSHPAWDRVSRYIVFPDVSDQAVIHEKLLYRIKQNRNLTELGEEVMKWLSRYHLDSFIAGCTELHLVSKHLLRSGTMWPGDCVDPLYLVAEKLAACHLSAHKRGHC